MSKYVAPILSALVVVVMAAGYVVFFFIVLNGIDTSRLFKIVIIVISLFVVIGVSVALVSRIKELRGGKEDDIGKY